MFYRDRNGHRIAHGCNAVCNALWFGHEASAESTLLYAITRTADINIDFIVAKVLCNAGTSGQGDWVIAAELKRDGMLDWVIGEMSSLVAMQNRAGCHHLSVEQRRCERSGASDIGSADLFASSWAQHSPDVMRPDVIERALNSSNRFGQPAGDAR